MRHHPTHYINYPLNKIHYTTPLLLLAFDDAAYVQDVEIFVVVDYLVAVPVERALMPLHHYPFAVFCVPRPHARPSSIVETVAVSGYADHLISTPMRLFDYTSPPITYHSVGPVLHALYAAVPL